MAILALVFVNACARIHVLVAGGDGRTGWHLAFDPRVEWDANNLLLHGKWSVCSGDGRLAEGEVDINAEREQQESGNKTSDRQGNTFHLELLFGD